MGEIVPLGIIRARILGVESTVFCKGEQVAPGGCKGNVFDNLCVGYETGKVIA